MFKRIIYMAPGTGIVYKDHQTDSSPPEYIKGIKTLIHRKEILLIEDSGKFRVYGVDTSRLKLF